MCKSRKKFRLIWNCFWLNLVHVLPYLKRIMFCLIRNVQDYLVFESKKRQCKHQQNEISNVRRIWDFSGCSLLIQADLKNNSNFSLIDQPAIRFLKLITATMWKGWFSSYRLYNSTIVKESNSFFKEFKFKKNTWDCII